MTKKENGIPVTLAGRDFVVRRIPMARVRTIGTTLSAVFKDFGDADVADQTVIEAIINRALEFPYEILKLFIKDLPKEIFEDEEDGVTFPEFIETLEIAINHNRLDSLKNFFSRLFPTIQASLSQLKN